MNLKTAARRLGVHYQTAYRWVRSGELTAVKVGTSYEVSDAALERFLIHRSMSPAGSPATAQGPAVAIAPADGGARARVGELLSWSTSSGVAVIDMVAAELADALGLGCVVRVPEEDGTLRVLAVRNPSPPRLALLDTLVHSRPLFLHEVPGVRGRRTGRSGPHGHLLEHVDHRRIRRAVPPEVWAAFLGYGFTGMVTLPMVATGGVGHASPPGTLLGIAQVYLDTVGPPLTAAARQLADDLTALAAHAIEREHDHRAAWARRRGLLDTARTLLGAGQDPAPLLQQVRAGADPVAVLTPEGEVLCVGTSLRRLLGGTTRASHDALTEAFRAAEPEGRSFARLLSGEVDLLGTVVRPRYRGDEVALDAHLGIVRRQDATPAAVVATFSVRHG